MTPNMIFFLFNVPIKKTMLFPSGIHWRRTVWPTLNINNVLVLLIIILTGICNIAIAQRDRTHSSFAESSDLKGHGFDEGKIKSIDSLLQSFVHDKKVNCVAAFVAKGDNIV